MTTTKQYRDRGSVIGAKQRQDDLVGMLSIANSMSEWKAKKFVIAISRLISDELLAGRNVAIPQIGKLVIQPTEALMHGQWRHKPQSHLVLLPHETFLREAIELYASITPVQQTANIATLAEKKIPEFEEGQPLHALITIWNTLLKTGFQVRLPRLGTITARRGAGSYLKRKWLRQHGASMYFVGFVADANLEKALAETTKRIRLAKKLSTDEINHKSTITSVAMAHEKSMPSLIPPPPINPEEF